MKNNKMKLISIILLCLASIFLKETVCFSLTASQLSQFGITWTFDREYEYGQFANGDYWVVGPLTIIDIDPASIDEDGRIINGSMVNPSPALGTKQGYDSNLYGTNGGPEDYDPNLNAARPNGGDLFVSNPLILQPGSSLVSAITISASDPFINTQLETAAILTVLSALPPEGSFRPPYSGNDKTVKFNKSQLNYSLLANLEPVNLDSVPRLVQEPEDGQADSVERMFERPWLNHIPGWMSDYHHPLDNMPDYYGDIADQIGIASLMLNLNYAANVKETLLIRFVQLGIDNYGVIKDGGKDNFVDNSGCKWPILFAGLMLNDADMKKIGEKSGDYLKSGSYGPGNPPPDYIHFQEDDQTFYVDAGTTGGYTAEDIGLPEWGMAHATEPGQDLKDWAGDDGFRLFSSAIQWGGFILSAHIMNARDLWNHDALFDYQDRYMEVEQGFRQFTPFVEEMWDAYRENYKPIWTRNDPSDVYSQGHYIEEDILLGDVSGNGRISSYDASLAAQYAVGLITLEPDAVLRADVTCNGRVSSYDASLIAQYAVGLIEHF